MSNEPKTKTTHAIMIRRRGGIEEEIYRDRFSSDKDAELSAKGLHEAICGKSLTSYVFARPLKNEFTDSELDEHLAAVRADERAKVEARVKQLEEACEFAESIFREYSQIHRDKGNYSKAFANEVAANQMRDALLLSTAPVAAEAETSEVAHHPV